ncbi:hypothetical protein [Peptostreptococcus sp. D1]|uniref:hypothetical protein n=1 Tax=Peptostreptococcus sp. D1 TaxID=72304 RepID=UPI0008E9BF47|nr:hypothetical protein [Peptostreptococcus sp. D1]SFE84164.1 hypothetical protein SAMN02910278_01846 [Peptostreptococcus sp. D1]
MDKEKLNFNDPDAIPGVITKVSSISPLEITDDDLKKINKYTLTKLTAEEVFIFKVTMADNEQDDRNNMPFNLKALQDLKKLYPGKTMLKDHKRNADNQIGRVYDTELVQNPNKTTDLGELHTELVAKIYMVVTESNKDLIAEIKGGIKKEVSTSTVANKMICSICGCDNMKDYCRHWPGREYEYVDLEGKTSKKRCNMLLDGAKDAFEVSFVAVPAQPRAGTTKSVGFTKPVKESTGESTEENKNTNEDTNVSKRLERAVSFLNANFKEEI